MNREIEMKNYRKNYIFICLVIFLFFLTGCFRKGRDVQVGDDTVVIQPTEQEDIAISSESNNLFVEAISQQKVPRNKSLIDDSIHKLYQEQIPLETNNDESLSQIIDEEMSKILSPYTVNPRYTVYIENVMNSREKTFVSNWSPSRSQFSASTIKLYVLIAVYEQYQSGNLSLDDTYTLKSEDIVQGAGKMLYDPIGTIYSINKLCQLMMSESDNIATNVLIDIVGGFEVVNETIASIEGENHYSVLQRKMMDTNNIENGLANRIDAKGAVQTLLKIYKGELLGEKLDQELLTLMSRTKNKTKLAAKLPKEAKIYHKTGESSYRGIENDFGIIEYGGEIFGIAVLIQVNGEGEYPEDATDEQMSIQKEAIANIGQRITLWIGGKSTVGQ